MTPEEIKDFKLKMEHFKKTLEEVLAYLNLLMKTFEEDIEK